jgi:CheY-like chemotaxis protein
MTNTAKTILLIDDSEVFRRGLSRELEEDSYNVLQAADGLQGIETALQYKPDLVITDIDMPVMNGVEVARMIRRQMGPSIPIIAISMHPAEDVKPLAIKAGCTEYLSKPFALDQFRALLSELIPM